MKHTRTGNIGTALTSIDAVMIGIERGWTVKETAFETGWSIRKIQKVCHRTGLRLAYGGQGPKPGWVHPRKGKGK